jgi:hypothetical protein
MSRPVAIHSLRPDGLSHGGSCTRCDAVGQNVVFRALNRQSTGKTNDGSLGSRVVGLSKVADWQRQSLELNTNLQMPTAEAVVTILPYFCFWNTGQTALAHCCQIRSRQWTHLESTTQVHRKDLIPLITVHGLESFVTQNTSVGNQNVHGSKGVKGSLDDGIALFS